MLSEEVENCEDISKRTNNEDHHDEPSSAKRRRLGDRISIAGWICALALEMTAARLMLDELHITLPNPPQDQNTYVFGEICGHNVVITCLPLGVYGNNSAAVVATHLMSTFRSISVPLMVGIGGGVPQPGHDIRLGDIVVGTPSSEHAAVVQYDFGKTVSNGVFEHKGTLNKPRMSLLNLLSNLRSAHQVHRSQISIYIANALKKRNLDNTDFDYPGAESDVLFETECDHVPTDSICTECGPLKPVIRAPRQNSDPIIHYGTIASGNQVIKHARTRDQLARQYGALCFEMEAASLMDPFSCLVIRGICDYCDTNKNKQYQGYAALASAAFAKELLSFIPKNKPSAPVITREVTEATLQHRHLLMEALDFDEADTRRATVRKAHSQTCRWLLEQQEYRDWMDPDKFSQHFGLLWIKGKAGSGKSTLIKYILEEVVRSKVPNLIIVSFFFNARGTNLEKSIVGMYRSLVHQLLKQLPGLQIVLDALNDGTKFDLDQLQFLQDTFEYVLKNLGTRTLICFVDALDECPEEQIRDMMDFFTELERLAVTKAVPFYVCVSSRYYPNISIDIGQQLDLEKQAGHSNDILQYIKSELKIGKSKRHESLKTEIAQKSNGIFLWVVLVVQILKKEYDRGMVHKMSERIKTIPQELDKLFRDILTRDNNDLPSLMLCMQWMLYSKRQLNRQEFYFAMRSGYDDFNGEPWDDEEISVEVMDNFILTCSKGLVELTRGRDPTVQFIHESVREFLAIPNALLGLWYGFCNLSEGSSHERLKECCYQQLFLCNVADFMVNSDQLGASESNAKSPEAVQLRKAIYKRFPFLDYAVHQVMYHADLAEVSQTNFLLNFRTARWLGLWNLIQIHQKHRLPGNLPIEESLIRLAIPGLLRQLWEAHPPSLEFLSNLLFKQILKSQNIQACKTILSAYYSYDQPMASKDVEYVSAILELIEDVSCYSDRRLRSQECLELCDILVNWSSVKNTGQITKMLHIASKMRRKAAVRLSLEGGANVHGFFNVEGDLPSSPLAKLSARPPEHRFNPEIREGGNRSRHHPVGGASKSDVMSDTRSCLSLLLAAGLSLSDPGITESGILTRTSRWADVSVLQFLLDHGAKLSSDELPLHAVVQIGNFEKTRFWLDQGISTNTQDNGGNTPLHLVQTQQIAQLLIDSGASINVKNSEGCTPLHAVCKNEYLDEAAAIVNLLVIQLADLNDVNSITNSGWTPLHMAARFSKGEVVDALLRHKANIDSVDNYGETPLHVAARFSKREVVDALLRHGANVNSITDKGRTPLHMAAEFSRGEVVDALLRHGADVDSVDNYGETPLHVAVHFSISNICHLIHGGAQIHRRDRNRRLPIQVAATKPWGPESAQALFNHGAEPEIPIKEIWDAKEGANENEWMRMVENLLELQSSRRKEPCCDLYATHSNRMEDRDAN